MEGEAVHGIDAFGTLFTELLYLHRREVATLEAEVNHWRNMSVTVERTDACKGEAPTTGQCDACLHAPSHSLGTKEGAPQRHARAHFPGDTMSTEHEPIADEVFEFDPLDPMDPDSPRESGSPRSCGSSPQTYVSSASVATATSAMEGVLRVSTDVAQRIRASIERSPSGLAAIRVGPDAGRLDYSSLGAFFYSLVQHSHFEKFFCMLIFLNACVLAVETQSTGLRIREALWNQTDMPEGSLQVYQAVQTASLILGIMFILELAIKLVGLRSRFGLDYWNWVDLLACVAWAVSHLEGDYLPVNSQVLRLFRLARFLRLLKLLRRAQGFDHLHIMTTAIKGSASVMTWTFLLLSLVQMVIALFLTQHLHDQYFDPKLAHDAEARRKQQEVFVYFGTFTRAFFTTFELTLANWPPACRVLAENVSDWFFVFAVLYKVSMGFAVIGVINGVFVQETFRVVSMDDCIMMRQKARAVQAHRSKMSRLFKEAVRKDGSITREDWIEIVNDEQVQLWLASMELDAADAEKLFDLMDESQDGSISCEELTKGVARLRGSARSIDLQVLIHEQQRLGRLMDCIVATSRSRPGTVRTTDFSYDTSCTDLVDQTTSRTDPVGQTSGHALAPMHMEYHQTPRELGSGCKRENIPPSRVCFAKW